MDRLEENEPVLVYLALDDFQYHHHSSCSRRPINAERAPNLDHHVDANLVGIVVGYNAESDTDPYWLVMTQRHGFHNNMIKVYMNKNGDNFGHIIRRMVTLGDITSDSPQQ